MDALSSDNSASVAPAAGFFCVAGRRARVSSLKQLLETNPGLDKSTSDALYDSWREWGVSPSISSDPPGTPVDFSASTYAMMKSAGIILALLDKADVEANDIDRTG